MTNLPAWILDDKTIPVDPAFRATEIVHAPIPESDWWTKSKLKRKKSDPGRDFWRFVDAVGWGYATAERYEEWRTEDRATVKEVRRTFQNSWPGPVDEFEFVIKKTGRKPSWTREQCERAVCIWLNAPDTGAISQFGYRAWRLRQQWPSAYPSPNSISRQLGANWAVKALEIARRGAA